MRVTKEKKPACKGHTGWDSSRATFWKRQNCETVKWSAVAGVGEGGMTRRSTGGF